MVWFQRFKKFVDNQRSACEMKEDSDFFMVLPSNASPDTHPKNTATDFTVSLQNPIKLDPKRSWKVALMDMSHSHERLKDCGITYRFYGKQRHVFPIQVTISHPDYQVSPKFLNLGNRETGMITIECSIYKKDDILGFWSEKIPFELKTWHGKEVKSTYHQQWKQFYCNDDYPVSRYFPYMQPPPVGPLTMTIHCSIIAYFKSEENNIPIPNHIMMRSPFEIVQYMSDSCGMIFNNLHLEDHMVKFGLAERVHYIKFFGGFGPLIGFSNDVFQATATEKENLSLYHEYKRALSTFQGESISLLHYGNHNFHILSNICKNVDVGNAKMPLLKTVSIDTSPATGVHGYS